MGIVSAFMAGCPRLVSRQIRRADPTNDIGDWITTCSERMSLDATRRDGPWPVKYA